MFVKKKFAFPKVLKGYKDFLVEVKYTKKPNDGFSRTYIFSHPIWKRWLRLSLTQCDSWPWTATLEGSFSIETANNLLSPIGNVTLRRFKITNQANTVLNFWDEASIVVSSEKELTEIIERFMNYNDR